MYLLQATEIQKMHQQSAAISQLVITSFIPLQQYNKLDEAFKVQHSPNKKKSSNLSREQLLFLNKHSLLTMVRLLVTGRNKLETSPESYFS